jgi:hypothetical protein
MLSWNNGPNHPVTWYNISEDWRPQLQLFKGLKPHTGLLPCFDCLEKLKNNNINVYLTNIRDKTLPQTMVIKITKENKIVCYFPSANKSEGYMVWKYYWRCIQQIWSTRNMLHNLKNIPIQEWQGSEIIYNSKLVDHYEKPNSVTYLNTLSLSQTFIV